jgi:flagellar motor switch protein FliM
MSMPVPTSPAEMRAYIIERLVGETGEPDRVTGRARDLVEKAVPAIRDGLKARLGLDVALEVSSVELSRMTGAKPEGDGHAMTVAGSKSSADALVMAMDAEAVALAVSVLFGGDPGIAVAPIRRNLSPTETVVASRVFEEIAAVLGATGDGLADLDLPVPHAISGDELRKLPLRDGPGARILLSVSTQAGCGTITLTVPQRLLLKGDGGARTRSGPTAQWRQRFGEEVMRSAVELQATMPLARMTLNQIAGLRPGQVIEFEPDAQSRAKLSTRKKTLFVCEFGKLGQNYTVRIRQPFDAGQDMMEGLVASR